jgi:PAS domain S-box-containing protein
VRLPKCCACLLSGSRHRIFPFVNSEDRTSTNFSLAPCFILQLGPDGTVLYVNRDTMGLKPRDLLGRKFTECLPANHAAWFARQVEQVTKTHEPQDLELSTVNRAGQKIAYLVNLSPIVQSETLLGFYLMGLDITARSQAEERLNAQMEENQHLLRRMRRRNLELETLAEISTMLRRAQSRPEMIALMVTIFRDVVGAQACSLLLVEEDALVVPDAAGAAAGLAGIRVSRGPDPLWDIIRSGTALIQTHSVHDESGTEPNDLFRILTAGLNAYAFIPIKAVEVPVGILLFGYQASEDALQEHFNLMQALAGIAGNALYRSQMDDKLELLAASRTQDLETIYTITSVASQAADLRQALENALDQMLPAIKSTAGAVFFLDESGEWIDLVAQRGVPEDVCARLEHQPVNNTLEGWIVENNAPLILRDLSKDPRAGMALHPDQIWSFLGVPMHVRGRVVGALTILAPRIYEFNMDEIALLGSIADHLGLAVENAWLRREAEHAAVMQERSRLSRDLHDSVTQMLYSVTLYARAGQNMAEQGRYEQAREYLQELGTISQQALREMRLLVYELRPPVLDQDGLIGAIQQRLDAVEGRCGINAHLAAARLPALSLAAEEGLYRIALEALNNVLKHANASQVTVELKSERGRIYLSVTDDGDGMDPALAAESGGMGLASMRERAEKLGGDVQFTSQMGQGTRISVSIPVSRLA